MRTSSKYVFCVLSISVCVAVTLYIFHIESGDQKMRTQNLPITTDTITALDNRTFIIAPYYEPRLNHSVRVISIIHESVEELYCIFHCSPNQNVFIRAQIDVHRDKFGFPYGAGDLLCAEPSGCNYTYMSFSTTISTNTSQNLLHEVRNRPPQPISANFTVCISTLYGNYNNVLQMIQSIEMYKILGASRVTIYNTSCSQDVDKVLRHYIDEGTLEVVPWPIDRHLKTSKYWKYTPGLNAKISYYGQISALNDCLYRNMYRGQFVFTHDIDEIILPVKDRDWSSMMERFHRKNSNTSVYYVKNFLFPTAFNTSGFDLWPRVPGVNILRHGLREPYNRTVFNPRKMFLNPRDIFQTSVHSVPKRRGKEMTIEQDTAIMFHCRNLNRNDFTSKDLVPDDTLRRHNASLVPKVNEVIQKLFPQL